MAKSNEENEELDATLPLGFDEMVEGELTEEGEAFVKINAAEFFGYPEDDPRGLITLRDPSVARFYAAGKDARVVQKKYPRWPLALCAQVSLLGLAHVSPVSRKVPITFVYARMADKNHKLFMKIIGQFYHAFPHYQGLVDEDAKNE